MAEGLIAMTLGIGMARRGIAQCRVLSTTIGQREKKAAKSSWSYMSEVHIARLNLVLLQEQSSSCKSSSCNKTRAELLLQEQLL